MQADFTLPSGFWTNFIEHYWDKSPVVIKQPSAAPLATTEDVFQGLFNASERYRAGGQEASVGFYVEQFLHEAEIKKHLIECDDKTLDGYAEKNSRRLDGRRFCLSVANYQEFDARVYLRLREFLRGLSEVIGMPESSAGVGLFFGNYEKTPFGLHRDGAGNFTFVLAGRKRILAWPDEYFSGHEDVRHSLDYEPFRDDAVVLEGEAGDIMYWPPNYWHIAESVGGLPLTLSVGHFRSPAESSAKVFKHLARKIEKSVCGAVGAGLYPLNPNKLQERADQLPLLVAQFSTALRDASQDPQLVQSLRVAWLNRLSSFGFDAVPPLLPQRTLADEDVVQGDLHFPVLWLPTGEDEIVCSANGHAFSITAHPNVLKLLEELNRGAPCRVRCLIARYAGTSQVGAAKVEVAAEDLRAVLEKLWSLRAITRLPKS